MSNNLETLFTSHLISLQLVFLFGCSPVILHVMSSIKCWNKILPANISSFTSSNSSTTSSSDNERHLFILMFSTIFSIVALWFATQSSLRWSQNNRNVEPFFLYLLTFPFDLFPILSASLPIVVSVSESVVLGDIHPLASLFLFLLF